MKRFSRYNFALRAIRSITDQDTPVAAPAGTPLEKYQKYRKGDVVLEYPRDTASLPGSFDTVSVNPFGSAFGASNNIKVEFSDRARSAGGAIVAACRHSPLADEHKDKPRGFKPAKAIVANLPDSRPAGTETSQITGLRYKPSGAVSYTFPYGKGSATEVESEVRAAITNAATQVFGDNTVINFNSERL